MKIKVQLFGMLSEKAGALSVEVADVENTDEVMRQLIERFPSIQGMQCNISVNQTIYKENVDVYDGDEVALLPPFAGG